MCGTSGYNNHNPPVRFDSPPSDHTLISPWSCHYPPEWTNEQFPITWTPQGANQVPSAWPMVNSSQSDRSVFLLTTLLSTAKLCNPNVWKWFPIQVSSVQCLFYVKRPVTKGKGRWHPSGPLGNYFVWCTWYACGQVYPINRPACLSKVGLIEWPPDC